MRSITRARATIQERFDSRRLADRLEQVTLRRAFTDEDKRLHRTRADVLPRDRRCRWPPGLLVQGRPAGFVRVVDDVTLAFPSYDGNGQFRSLGNVLVNPHVGMLFIDFEATKRIRVNGIASIDQDDPLLAAYPGADMVVRVRRRRSFRTARATSTSCKVRSCLRIRRAPTTSRRCRRGSRWMRFATTLTVKAIVAFK